MSGAFKPNEAQKKAVEFCIDRPLKVIAGAGTGKTELLTRRFVYLVKHYKLEPYRILALTFTKKAAAEMRRRIVQALMADGLMDKTEAALLSWIGNFHSISMKILKQHPLQVGLDPFFEIIDETEQRLLFRGVIEDFLNKRLPGQAEYDFENLMIRSSDDFMEDALAIVNRLKTHFIGPEEGERARTVLNQQYEDLSRSLLSTAQDPKIHKKTRDAAERRFSDLDADRSYEELFSAAVYIIYRNYQDRLQARNLVDFSDLIFHAYRLVNAEPLIKRKFDYILVDEFQDTDQGQYRLLKALSDDMKNVTAVGDRKQLIYEWREATLGNIEEFPGERLPLEENYRSFGQILEAANGFICRTMEGETPLKTALDGGRGLALDVPVRLFRAENRESECLFVAREISSLLKQGHAPGDIAILIRSIYTSQFLEDALEAENIPFETVGGCGFYDYKETKDVSALLRLVCNPFDDHSMVRILQSEIIGLNDASLNRICRQKKNGASSIFDVLKTCEIPGLRPDALEKTRKLILIIEELARAKWFMPMGELFSEALKRMEYLKYLSSREGSRGPRFRNVALFYKMITLFEERHPHANLEGFLQYLELAVSSNAKTSAGNLVSDKVQIMTIHQAKGLEFPIVFVVGVAPNSFPSKFRSANFGYEDGFGIYAKRRPDGELLTRYEGTFGRIEAFLREKQYLEENRIMYVAMTRAKNLLYVTTFGEAKDTEADFFQALEALSQVNPASVSVIPSEDVERPVEKESEEVSGNAADEEAEVSLLNIVEAAAAALTRISGAAKAQRFATPTVKATFSKIALFRQCPRKYALTYLYRLPLSADSESTGVFEDRASFGPGLGNLLHQTLMQYHRELKERGTADAIEIFLDRGRIQNCPRKVMNAGRRMLQNYLESPLSTTPSLFEEKEFHWRIRDGDLDIMIDGKVDRIHLEGEALKIIDYKSGAPHVEHDRLQLALYKLAIESVLGESNISTSNFYFSTGEEVEHQFGEDELLIVRSDIIRDIREMAELKRLPEQRHEDQGACLNCEFKGLCE